MTATPVRVVLVDDHAMFRAGVRAELAASGDAGAIEEVQSPDDNLQAVFKYLVKQ